MSWQAETGSSEQTPSTAKAGLSRSYLRDLKSLGDGRYRIIDLAGKGGMSQVFHAYDTVNDRDVAIKVLSLDLVSEETFLARFKRESELMRDFNHPNILRAYEYGQEEDKIYLVMSYYGGGTLKDRLNQGPLSLGQVSNYLNQMAAGLGYAHSRNIIHRDIKPSNVLIHHAGDNLVISDFGIAKALSNANPARTGTIMGTPLYMAPEQFLDKADQRSDIYSLGIVLYQMLTGEVPFKGDGIGFKHLYDQVPPLKTWEVNYDPAIENVVARALAKRPEARFQTVGEMAQAFQAAVQEVARRDTIDSFKGVNSPAQNTTWNSLEKDPAVLPGQASLTELRVITPSQLKTEQPVNSFYLEQTTPLSLNELQRFDNEPLPFHSLSKPFAEEVRSLPLAPFTEAQETTELSGELPAPAANNSRAYVPLQFEGPPKVRKTAAPAATPQKGKAAPPRKGAIAPARKSQPVPARKSGFKWWLLVFPLILIAALAVAAFVVLGNPFQASSAAVTPTAGSILPAMPGTQAATTAPATSIAANPSPTLPLPTAPVLVGSPGTPAAATTSAASAVRNAVIVFTSEYNDEGLYDIYSYDTQTRILTRLTQTNRDSLPSFSPDGSKIIYQHEQSNGSIEIWQMDPDGSKQTRLVAGAMNPEFAHNSLSMVYVGASDNELYTATLDKGTAQNTVKLTSTGGKPKRGPAFSYDDKKIAFGMEDDRKIYQIYTLDLGTPNAPPVKLTDFSDRNALWPQFSPDSSQIVFSTNDNNPNLNERLPLDIYIINADGSGSQRIVGNTGHNSHPVWVADPAAPYGSRIFFNSDRGASEWARIYSMNPVSDLTKADQRIFYDHKDNGQDAPYNDYATTIFFKK